MEKDAADLAGRLGSAAEAVCRHYLSAGVREGRYWRVGDALNSPGRSMFVRLQVSEDGRPAGKWSDAATGEHGDLLDIIARTRNLRDFAAVKAEAQRFLALPQTQAAAAETSPVLPGASPASARRLFAAAKPIAGTPAEHYLRARGIRLTRLETRALRFHPRCFYWTGDHAPKQEWPALLGAVTDASGEISGLHRTWIASLDPPRVHDRRAMGHLLGRAVRFGASGEVLVAGEGIETTLSLRQIMPAMPLAAALSSAHLGAIGFGPRLKRLYVLRDADAAGDHAFARLSERGDAAGVDVIDLFPKHEDFNTDLRRHGAGALAINVAGQLMGVDARRFLRA
jgi:hypothetical protein